MNDVTPRWEQRFANFLKALKKLDDAVGYAQAHLDSAHPAQGEDLGSIHAELVRQGVIQSFEFTHELAWNVIKDYAAYQGNPEIRGSRDAARAGFKMGLIEAGEAWMEMIESRNQTSHTYDQATADLIYQRITEVYIKAFIDFKHRMLGLTNEGGSSE